LAISDSFLDMLDMPCPAETRCDLGGLLLEGPALLVWERLHLADGGDWSGDIGSSSLLEESSDL
jgi:hypothetical protein